MSRFVDEVTGQMIEDMGQLDEPLFFILGRDGCAVACASSRAEANRTMLKLGLRATHWVEEI